LSEAVGRLLGRLARGGKVPAADFTPFYLTAPNERLYRAAMDAFVQAKRRFTVHLRPEDARESIGGAAEYRRCAHSTGGVGESSGGS
jgi:hypothetical protein